MKTDVTSFGENSLKGAAKHGGTINKITKHLSLWSLMVD